MAGVYSPRHPDEYESRFEREYGFFRPIIQEVVERYLDCGNPRCGFARIRCPDCGEERLPFSPEGKVYRLSAGAARFLVRICSRVPLFMALRTIDIAARPAV